MNSNVSVVIPYYNAAQTLLRALESISKQTRQALEIIIVNDGSNFDELKIIVDEWGGVAKVVDLNGNYGAAYARNVGVSESVGKFVAFLDSDDIWHPDKLELQEELMIRTNAFFSCHGYVFDLKKNKFNSCSKGIKKYLFV
ncbi:glycosyltransferase family 2 protein [Deefgea sp. CFH1-16]|uniref:glycosyltransferase family 2 protein n=1 Tax=Deefgea sp. CFH1-16 TaxID=2675457 RepID=UPI0015F5BB1A|nr:glycosyltransferase family 2 protein [Deefgea sp. CFH1-16]MBM5573549.1 glycosyltransferase [Deefgea sp. CFH1-16]